jgi:predicted PolB exonuclease-like 3'-5' exonuclease
MCESITPLVLDIETVPLEDALTAPYPESQRTPPANYKSEDAIAKWREKDRADWQQARVKECSLNPRLGRIVSIGMQRGDDELYYDATDVRDEERLLGRFWEAVAAARGKVVTWNGSWDLRFLLLRSIAHGITPTVPPSVTRDWFKKYTSFPHFDCKAVLTNWDVPKAGEGLTEWATFLGIEGKTDGVTGADVYGMVQRGEWDALREYNMADVRATAAVYSKIAPYFG